MTEKKKMSQKQLIGNGIFAVGILVALLMLMLGVFHIFGGSLQNKFFPDVMNVFFWKYLVWGILALILAYIGRKLYLKKA